MGVGLLNLLGKFLLQKKKMKEYETKLSETICIDLQFPRKSGSAWAFTGHLPRTI